MSVEGSAVIRSGIITLVLAFVLGGGACRAGDSPETVTIDSVTYKVPARWVGRKLDSSRVADESKLVPLPAELCPEGTRVYVTPATRTAFIRMAAAAKKDSILLKADSGYRSAAFQRRIIRRRMAEGRTFDQVCQFVAPPGYSQHQTGRALDLVPSEAVFANTPTYAWLKKHAGKYGFVESIPKPPKNGGDWYWEAWHWYYKGK